MNDQDANKVIFIILIFIILGILFILNIFAKAYVWNNILDKIRNNSGNYTTTKILMMFVAFIALSFIIYWLLYSRSFKYDTLVQRKEGKPLK